MLIGVNSRYGLTSLIQDIYRLGITQSHRARNTSTHSTVRLPCTSTSPSITQFLANNCQLDSLILCRSYLTHFLSTSDSRFKGLNDRPTENKMKRFCFRESRKSQFICFKTHIVIILFILYIFFRSLSLSPLRGRLWLYCQGDWRSSRKTRSQNAASKVMRTNRFLTTCHFE